VSLLPSAFWLESLLPPTALAVEVALLEAVLAALSVKLPPVVTELPTDAVVTSSPTVIAIAAPIAALPPAALPSALLLVVPVCVAVALKFPLTDNVPPTPSEAVVVFVGRDNATAGAAPTFPPLAPACTLDVIALLDVAASVTFRAPVSVTLSPICASVEAGTWFIANDAPTPTLPPDATELAVAVLFVLFTAVIVTSGVEPVSATLAPLRIAACAVSELIRFSATEPATPAVPPLLAPDVAVATNVLVPGEPPLLVVADRASPPAEIVSVPWISAWFVAFTTFTATPAPNWNLFVPALPPCEPSTPPPLADALAFVSLLLESVSRPPDLIVTLPGSEACAVLVTLL